MRDEQVRRYARHILLPDVGGLGQTALLVSTARLVLRDSEPEAELVAASYLAAGGVGRMVVANADQAQVAVIAAHGPDTRIEQATTHVGREVELAPKPAWWPGAEGDHTALAYWRGGIAAVRWMADVSSR